MVYVMFNVECLMSKVECNFQLLTFNIQLCEATAYAETAEVERKYCDGDAKYDGCYCNGPPTAFGKFFGFSMRVFQFHNWILRLFSQRITEQYIHYRIRVDCPTVGIQERSQVALA